MTSEAQVLRGDIDARVERWFVADEEKEGGATF
jgi:hypothetical protein